MDFLYIKHTPVELRYPGRGSQARINSTKFRPSSLLQSVHATVVVENRRISAVVVNSKLDLKIKLCVQSMGNKIIMMHIGFLTVRRKC